VFDATTDAIYFPGLNNINNIGINDVLVKEKHINDLG